MILTLRYFSPVVIFPLIEHLIPSETNVAGAWRQFAYNAPINACQTCAFLVILALLRSTGFHLLAKNFATTPYKGGSHASHS